MALASSSFQLFVVVPVEVILRFVFLRGSYLLPEKAIHELTRNYPKQRSP